MKTPWTRLLSAILTAVLLLQIAPLQAFAAADTGTADDGSGALLSGTETVPAADVVGEVESLRTEEGKHFRLSDGSYLAVSYGTPVHYQDASGRWQEIDNRANRAYASQRVEELLGPDAGRTQEDISAEIFGHMFVADCILPLSLFSGILQRSKQGEKWDIYGRVSEPDIDERESRLQWFYRIEAIFG